MHQSFQTYKVQSIAILVGLLVICHTNLLLGQEMPALYPDTYTIYDIDNGLPFNCVDGVYSDALGGLWLNQCQSESCDCPSFAQFDGHRIYELNIQRDSDIIDSTQWSVEGISPTGKLFGPGKDFHQALIYDPKEKRETLYRFDNSEKLCKLIPADGDSIIAITRNANSYVIYLLYHREKSTLVQLKRNYNQQVKESYAIPALYKNDRLWMQDGLHGFVEVDLKQGTSTAYDWKSLIGLYPLPNPQDITYPNMTFDRFGKIIFYVRDLLGFFTFDPVTRNMRANEELNSLIPFLGIKKDNGLSLYKDKKGNILIKAQIAKPNSIGEIDYTSSVALLTPDGKQYDYSAVSDLVRMGRFKNLSVYTFYSEDFTRNVLMTSPNGLIAADIKSELNIEVIFQGRPARGIAELEADSFLIFTDNGRAFLANRNNAISHFDFKKKSGLENLSVSSFSQMIKRGDAIWFAAEAGVLTSYHTDDHTFEHFKTGHLFDKFQFINKDEIIFADIEGEVFLYNLPAQKATPLIFDGQPVKLGGAVTGSLLASDGLIWFSTYNGLWSIDLASAKIRQWDMSSGLPEEHVMCLIESADHRIWMGTQNSGLVILNPASGEIIIRDKHHGFSNQTVIGLLQDDDGYVWASTYDGINVLDAQGKVLFDLNENDGLSHREFNRFSALKTSDGKLMFGGINGVSILDPAIIRKNFESRLPSRLYVSNISWYDATKKSEIDAQSLNQWPEVITIPATNRFISINLSTSDYAKTAENKYFYRFSFTETEGQDDTENEDVWSSIGNSSTLRINNLPVGEYDIVIKAMNYKGQWADQPVRVSIKVKEFFYKTWWFYLACSLPLLLLAYFWIRRLQMERIRLETEVQKRTEQIRTDKALIEQQAESLTQLDKAKTRIYTNITHEFRTPLTVIKGTSEMLEHDEEKKSILKRNADRLLNLVNQLLELSKLESGEMTMKMVRADMIILIRDIFDSFIPIAEQKDIGMHFYSRVEHLEMDLDFEVVHRIVGNLLSNALKFTQSGGDIYLEITHQEDSSSRHHEKLSISIRDTGVGIPEDKIDQVFNRFYQVDDSSTRAGEGTGVGLSLTKELVEFLGGTIQVHSAVGKGSEFVVTLPVSHVAARTETEISAGHYYSNSVAALSSPVDIEIHQEPDTNLPVVLVVEDNPDVIHYVISCLRGSYRVHVAMNGQEGFEKSIHLIPDIIISDVMMPEKDGIQMCDEIKHHMHTSHIPVVLLTAKADIQSRLDGLERGADAYITKPFEKDELLLTVKNLLTIREQYRIRYAGLSAPVLEEDPETRLDDLFISRLNENIDKHLDDEAFGVTELSRLMDYSRSQLHKKVKALTGLAPSAYIQRRRMYHARELMKSKQLNVSEIAYAVGFNDPSYFARVFRREFNITPTDFLHQLTDASSDI